MGSDELFKKRREARRVRKHDFEMPRASSYLIVTEGTRTEPYYFNGLKKRIIEKIGGSIDVLPGPEIEVCGEGSSTGKLIEIAEEYVNKANVIYQNVWVIFDKDDFLDFDEAITEGEDKDFKIGWSNQSFEYWLFLHFNYSDSDLHRYEWNDKLDALFKEYSLSKDGYKKNHEGIYDMLDSFGGVETAIKNAKRRMAGFRKGDKPSEYAPGTAVHVLVEELRGYLK